MQFMVNIDISQPAIKGRAEFDTRDERLSQKKLQELMERIYPDETDREIAFRLLRDNGRLHLDLNTTIYLLKK